MEKWAVDFVAEDNYRMTSCNLHNLFEFLFSDDCTGRVLWIARDINLVLGCI